MAYYLSGAIALFGLAFILIRGTSPFADIGCSTYDKLRARRAVALVLSIAATFISIIGMLAWLAP